LVGDYKAAMSHYTHSCFAAGDRLMLAEAVTKSRSEAKAKAKLGAVKKRNDALLEEIKKLPGDVLKNTAITVGRIKATVTYANSQPPIKDRPLTELVVEFKRKNKPHRANSKPRQK
jgi:cell division protein FtsB